MLSIVLIATFVPYVHLMISLVGSFAGSALSLIFPIIIDLAVGWREFHNKTRHSTKPSRPQPADAANPFPEATFDAPSRGEATINAQTSSRWQTRATWWWVVGKSIFIVVVGLTGCVVGTIIALIEIVEAIGAQDPPAPTPLQNATDLGLF